MTVNHRSMIEIVINTVSYVLRRHLEIVPSKKKHLVVC